jgi:hypothetical protein
MMHPSRPLTRSPRPRSAFGWQWCLPILGLALLVRLIWLYAPFTHDPTTLTACMRAMVHGGIREVLATVQDRIHLPWELYLLLVFETLRSNRLSSCEFFFTLEIPFSQLSFAL